MYLHNVKHNLLTQFQANFVLLLVPLAMLMRVVSPGAFCDSCDAFSALRLSKEKGKEVFSAQF